MGIAKPYHVLDGYSFVAYPNRNSVPFRDAYNIPEAHTVIRGSLRYEGNPTLVKALIELGWLDTSMKPWLREGMTWAQIQQHLTGAKTATEDDLIAQVDKLCHYNSADQRDQVISGLRWIGFFGADIPRLHDNLLDTLSGRLSQLCGYKEEERDLVMLQHKFVVEWQDGTAVSSATTRQKYSRGHGTKWWSRRLTCCRRPSRPPWSYLESPVVPLRCPSRSASHVAWPHVYY